MMTGLSLSLCIRDILNGVYAIDQVEMIVTGTCARYAHDFDYIVDGYGERYWQKDPEAGKRIFLALLLQGKIDQPRLRGEARGPNLQNGHWISSTSDQAKLLQIRRILAD